MRKLGKQKNAVRSHSDEIRVMDLIKTAKFHWLCLFFIIVSCLIIYSNSFDCSFQFDDTPNIIDNYQIRDLGNFKDLSKWSRILNRPLSMFTFALNYHFHKLDLFGYHLINLIIHITTSCLVYFLVYFIFSLPLFQEENLTRYKYWIALFTALLFAVHPIQTQSVTYIVQRMNSLAGMFYILSVLVYGIARIKHIKQGISFNTIILYMIAILSGILSVMSKQNGVTFPIAMLLFELCFIRDAENKLYKNYLIISFSFIITIFFVIFVTGNLPRDTIEISRPQYLITQFRVILKYIQLLAIPYNQHVDYLFVSSKSLWGINEICSMITLLALLLLAVWLFFKNRILSFCIFWFFITLSVESSIIPIRDVIFEHRLYMPMLGYSFFLVWGLLSLLKTKRVKIFITIMLLFYFGYGIGAYNRNKVWKTKLSFWLDNVQKSGEKARPLHNLANEYSRIGDYDKALEYFNKALDSKPGNPKILTGIGLIYREKGEIERALHYLNQAHKEDPKDSNILDELGKTWFKGGDVNKAVELYTNALSLSPQNVKSLENLADLYRDTGDVRNALIYYNRILEIVPDHYRALNNLGTVWSASGNFEKALEYYKKILKFKPYYVKTLYNMGNNLFRQGKLDDAIKYYKLALEIKPDYAKVLNNLGSVYSAKGDSREAIIYYKKALDVSPDYREAIINLKNETSRIQKRK